jgi:hypothetical protein
MSGVGIQPQPSAAELFSKDSIFFAQVINRVLLLLVHPAGHSNQDEPEGVKDFRCFNLQWLLCTWRPVRQNSISLKDLDPSGHNVL